MDKNRLAVNLFDRYAQRYQEKYMDQSRYRAGLDAFCGYDILRVGRTLELACGPGNVTRYLLNKCPDLDLLATDLSPEMLALAKANNPEVAVQLLDCRQVASLEGDFSGVVAAFVLPYLNPEEVQNFVNDVANLMLPGGIFYLSTMAGSSNLSGWQGPSDGGPDRLYMYYHEEKRLLEYLSASGLEVQFSERLAIDPKEEEPYDLVLIAQRPAANPG